MNDNPKFRPGNTWPKVVQGQYQKPSPVIHSTDPEEIMDAISRKNDIAREVRDLASGGIRVVHLAYAFLIGAAMAWGVVAILQTYIHHRGKIP